MKLILRAVGKLRDRRLEELCREYLERARRHLPIDVQEVDSGAALLGGLPAGAELIALDPEGQSWSTADFIAFLGERMLRGSRAVVFLIGGAEGLPANVRAAAKVHWSLSRLTFPHRIARVIVCEQIYRALSDIRGEPYNK